MLAERIRLQEASGCRAEDGVNSAPCRQPPPEPEPAAGATSTSGAGSSRSPSSSGGAMQGMLSKELGADLLPAPAPHPQSGAPGDRSDSNARAVDRAVKLVNRMLSGGKVRTGGPSFLDDASNQYLFSICAPLPMLVIIRVHACMLVMIMKYDYMRRL